MTTVLLAGRKLPHIDWEGDDFIPGSNGRWVSCTDSAAGRALYYATNGRKNLDGRTIRAAIHPHDPDGIKITQAKQAIEALTDTTVVIPARWHWDDVMAHLTARKGLIAQGWYAEIPRGERFQLKADFGHAVWLSHYTRTSGIRVWDALDANERHHGNWIPAKFIKSFMEELQRREKAPSLFCGYIPLQHL